MGTLIRVLGRLTKGVSQQVNTQVVTDFIVEVSQEVASPVSEQSDAVLLVGSIVLVGTAFTAKAAIPSVWRRIRNRHKTEVDFPREDDRG